MRADRLLHPIVQVALAPPPLERRPRIAIVWRQLEERLVRAHRTEFVAHAVLNLAEERARLRQLRFERERALELVFRIGVATLERRRHAGAEVKARVLRVGV